MADGPLTNILSIVCTADTSGSLVCVRGTTSGAATPSSVNLRVRTNNGALIVAPAAQYSS